MMKLLCDTHIHAYIHTPSVVLDICLDSIFQTNSTGEQHPALASFCLLCTHRQVAHVLQHQYLRAMHEDLTGIQTLSLWLNEAFQDTTRYENSCWTFAAPVVARASLHSREVHELPGKKMCGAPQSIPARCDLSHRILE